MKKSTLNSLVFGQFDILVNHPEIIHATFTRHGGVSCPPFDSLNFGSGNTQAPDIGENLRKIMLALKLPPLIDCNQDHKDQVFFPTETYSITKPCADILITNRCDVGLMIKHADCQAAIFYDPKKKVIANVHAGWRGCVQKVYTKTIVTMKSKFGCNPSNILACISPSLGPEHAEFKNFQQELPPSFWPFQTKPFYFDFWAIAEQELLEAGLSPNHIEMAKECTYANKNDYFSYRRDKVTGRHATVIAFNP